MDGKHKVCVLRYRKGNQPYVSYGLYADDDSGQITTLVRFAGFEHNSNREDSVDVSYELSRELDALLLRFPDSRPNHSDGHLFGSPLNIDNYDVFLYAKYGEKSYHYGRRSSFVMSNSNFEIWLFLVKKLLQMFEGLTGNKSQLRPYIEETIEAYKKSFHKKGRHSKYQKRWIEPQLSDWVYHHVSYRPFFDEFINEDISTDELRQLDYRHYLSSFLWLIAFQNTVRLYKPKPIDAMTAFKRLSETDVLNWDKDEQDALRDYFTALWDYVLTYYPPLGMDAFTFIHGVGLTGFDVTPHIKHWKASMDDISASRHLAGYVRSLYARYVESGAGVFDDVPKMLRRWLHDVGDGDYFLKRYMEYDGVRPFADEYAEASEMLSLLQEGGL